MCNFQRKRVYVICNDYLSNRVGLSQQVHIKGKQMFNQQSKNLWTCNCLFLISFSQLSARQIQSQHSNRPPLRACWRSSARSHLKAGGLQNVGRENIRVWDWIFYDILGISVEFLRFSGYLTDLTDLTIPKYSRLSRRHGARPVLAS